MSMSVFTDAEIDYVSDQGLGHIATVGADGMPHVIPVAVFYETMGIDGPFERSARDVTPNAR
jgi:Pyridoxamine 5'-phosphate oxidase